MVETCLLVFLDLKKVRDRPMILRLAGYTIENITFTAMQL